MTPIEEVRALLAAAKTETQYRTVASRAYFAAFNGAISVASRHGFVRRSSGDDHRDLIAFLKSSPSSLIRRIGHHRLPRLRAIRNWADYDQNQQFSHGMATEAAATAEEILNWLSNLDA